MTLSLHHQTSYPFIFLSIPHVFAFPSKRSTAAFGILVSMATKKPFSRPPSCHIVIFGSAHHAGSKYCNQGTGSRQAAAFAQMSAPVYDDESSSETTSDTGYGC